MIKILIVDDEILERDALRHILNKGMEVSLQIEEAQNGRESLAIFDHFVPDLIFMDIKMPGVNGLEAARVLRERSSLVKIVFLTAFHEFEYAHEAIKIGVQDYLIKPSTEEQILTITNKLIQEIEIQKAQVYQYRGAEQRLVAMTQHLEQEFLTQLFFHSMTNETFETYQDLLSIHSSWSMLATLAVDYDSYPIPVTSELHKMNLKKRCTTLAKQIFLTLAPKVLSLQTTEQPLFLLMFDKFLNDQKEAQDQFQQSIKSIIQSIVQRVRSELHLTISLEIGEGFQDLTKAKHALPGFSRPPGNNYEEENLLGLEQTLRLSLLRHDLETYGAGIRELKTWILDQMQPFIKTKKIVLELTTVLNHFYLSRLCCGGEKISEEALENSQHPETLLLALEIFFQHLFEQFDHQHEDSQARVQLSPLLAYIQKNYNKDISLDQAAELCSISLFHFTKVFKKVMGTTFVDYLTNIRMNHALALIESTEMNISEISQAVGYQDQGYFSKVFKKQTGLNPTEYRRKIFLT